MGGGLDWIFAVCFCLMSVSLGCDSDVSWQCSVVETADMEGVCVCVLLEQIIVKRKQPFQIIDEAQLL